jgi:hypothetical protein
MLLSRIAPAGALLFLSTIAGCALPATSGEDVTTSTEALSSETFTLYGDLEPDPSGLCDVHTVLTLSNGHRGDSKEPFSNGSVLRAHLRDEMVGSCKLYVAPDPRDYALLFESEECGSIVYSAATTVDGRDRSITVTDHRKRACKDIVAPARIVVEEREGGGAARTFYSLDGKKPLPVS